MEMKKHYTSVWSDNHGHEHTSRLSTWSSPCPSLHSKHLMTVPLIHPATGEFTDHSSSGANAGEGDRTEEGRSPTCGVTGATVFGVPCRFEPAHNTVLYWTSYVDQLHVGLIHAVIGRDARGGGGGGGGKKKSLRNCPFHTSSKGAPLFFCSCGSLLMAIQPESTDATVPEICRKNSEGM